MPDFPLGRVARATSTGELGQQQFQIVLLAPHQNETKQGYEMQLLHPGRWCHLGRFPVGLARRPCLTSLTLGIWIPGRTNVVVFSQWEVVRHSGHCKFHSCALCREVSHQGRNEQGTTPRTPNHLAPPKSRNNAASFFFSAGHLIPK